MARLLETSLQNAGLTEREVEDRLHWEPGVLGRILDGTLECSPSQLLAILGEIGPEQLESPVRRQRQDRGTRMVQDLIQRYRKLGYGTPAAASAAPGDSAKEIEKTVEEALRRTFGAAVVEKGKGRRHGGG